MEQDSQLEKPFDPFRFPRTTDVMFASVGAISVAGIVISMFLLNLLATYLLTNFILFINIESNLQNALYFVEILFVISLFLNAIPLLTACLIFFLKPQYTIRKERYTQMAKLYPDVESEVKTLASSAGVKANFHVLYTPSPVIEVYTFGNIFSKYMVISQGFLEKFRRKESEYKAVVYHELAHFVNKDIVGTEISLALLYTFDLVIGCNILLIIVTVALALVDQYTTKSPNVLYLILFMAITMLTVFLMIGLFLHYMVEVILRSREFYADARAVTFSHESRGLQQALTRMDAIAIYRTRKNAFTEGHKRLFSIRYHPATAERLEYLDNPGNFSRISFTIPVAAGIISYLASIIIGILLVIPLMTGYVLTNFNTVFDGAIDCTPIAALSLSFLIACGIVTIGFAQYAYVTNGRAKIALYSAIISCIFGGTYLLMYYSNTALAKTIELLIGQFVFISDLFVDTGWIDENVRLGLYVTALLMVSLWLTSWSIGRIRKCDKLQVVKNHPKIAFVGIPYVINIPLALVLAGLQLSGGAATTAITAGVVLTVAFETAMFIATRIFSTQAGKTGTPADTGETPGNNG